MLMAAFYIVLQHTLAKSEHLGLLEPFSDGGFFAGRELRRYAYAPRSDWLTGAAIFATCQDMVKGVWRQIEREAEDTTRHAPKWISRRRCVLYVSAIKHKF
ncbi:unnamed protein product [Ixodes pacificus]